MVNTNKLKGKMRECGITQSFMASELNVTEKTMNTKINKGIFKTDEIDKIMSVLNLSKEEAMKIFFANKVS